MKQFVPRFAALAVIPAAAAILAGCGGGGGGGGSVNTEVSGTVYNSLSDDVPVVGATVVIGGKSATTDSNGTFDIRNASVGLDTATVTPPGSGAVSQQIAFYPPVQPLPAEIVALYLYSGQISGTVTLHGQPASGAYIQDTEGTTTSTESDGTFLISGLSPGQQDTVTIVDGTASATVIATPPAGGGVFAAGIIALTDSGTGSLPPGLPAPNLTGTVSDPSTGPVTGALVLLFRNGQEVDSFRTAAGGAFGFYAPPGSGYTIEVQNVSGDLPYTSASFSVSATAIKNTPVTITLTPVS